MVSQQCNECMEIMAPVCGDVTSAPTATAPPPATANTHYASTPAPRAIYTKPLTPNAQILGIKAATTKLLTAKTINAGVMLNNTFTLFG